MTLTVTETSSSPPFFSLHELVRPNGTTICGPTTGSPLNCSLDSDGTHVIVVGDNDGVDTGNYTIRVTT